ncbi:MULTISPECIES: hypothetical protein [Streptomyces]|uniref:pPIWI-RE module N-terminal domain-containing protein n=1 Tax=Streptomyces dengpaensis TaxID=2049881 RepID=A0ABM6SLX7_9ACTN|nr:MULTISPECIES: hypothetical protein [Streptomyces]AVH55609.1 hypothetical protein C4B68_07235 [Streptomyces dengpaensis]PIB11871.1 hypothetical protein B1C81_01195 [Streptomyces sp. HG99]
MAAAKPNSAPRLPRSRWEYCLAWADLLMARRIERLRTDGTRLTEAETAAFHGDDRPLIVVLIAAALHERMDHFALPDDELHLVPLGAPGEEGVTGTLHRHPYQALENTPGPAGPGHAEVHRLLDAARSDHPDERGLWDRIRCAARETVVDVATFAGSRHDGRRHPLAQGSGTYWERGVMMADVLFGEQHRRQAAHLAAVFGEED